jgi:hypothetical protein
VTVRRGRKQHYALIAEWLGVALLERRGSRRAVWRGREYRTDKHVYFMARRERSENVGMYRIPVVAGHSVEQIAKEGIENMAPEQRAELASWADAWRVLNKRDDPPPTPTFGWDETARVFVQVEDCASKPR